MIYFVVQLEPGVWIANTWGDPGRTLTETFARKFRTRESAEAALVRARRYRDFKNASIEQRYSIDQ